MFEEELASRPDIYIGLVCAAGTDLTTVKQQIVAQLSKVQYELQEVKVSHLIKQLLSIEDVGDEYERMRSLMAGGDTIRRYSENGVGVGNLIVSGLRKLREESRNPKPKAYLIDSLKNPAELDLLQKLYGNSFFSVSVYHPKGLRLENLKNKIAKGRHEPPSEEHATLASKLIEQDEKGESSTGQNVQDTFPRAHFFISHDREVSGQILRFVNLVFQEPFTTPSRDEYFMFMAKATALRSCDLSRQVGAGIASPEGWIVASGCNEVPMPGGGFFEEPQSPIQDNRDHTKQYDPNYIEIQRSLIEFVDVLKDASIIDNDSKSPEIVHSLLHGKFKTLMSNARVRNLIEFGRVVHAEMHALSQAAAAGRSVKNGSLYVTTFPCHGCARHIIASGIREVVYIEPYPKSLTMHLYGDEIAISDSPVGEHQVRPNQPVSFRSFHGVSPTLYQRVFWHRPRKNKDGTKAEWSPHVAVPYGASYGVERPDLELAASQSIVEISRKIDEQTSCDKH